MPELSPASVSRILKRLLLHGQIKKVAHTHKYYLTKLGKAVITTHQFSLVEKCGKMQVAKREDLRLLV
jgi:Fe2+ or Zn2+ uptake regulation protein